MDLQTFPNFSTRPTEQYIHAWGNHIQSTGYPETFEQVSTTKPTIDDDLVLISAKIHVPTARREHADWVPCPLCRPTSPKFKIGRMAWFPSEKAVRFIGQKCAANHYGDTFTEADKRFNKETEISNLVQRWADIMPKRVELIELATQFLNAGQALQTLRERIEERTAGFLEHLYGTLARSSGRITEAVEIGTDQQGKKVYEDRTLGTFSGLRFIQPKAEFTKRLTAARSALFDAAIPLPEWKPGLTTPADEAEILKRGRGLSQAPKSIREMAAEIADCQQFFSVANFRLFQTWQQAGQSSFAEFDLRLEPTQLVIRAKSFAGQHYANVLRPRDLLMLLPAIPDDLLALA